MFDDTGCENQEESGMQFTTNFETQTIGYSSFISQKVGAFSLGVQLVSLSTLMTYLY